MQDRSQPDVYETSDLPEDDQHLDSQDPVRLTVPVVQSHTIGN